jgi:hypothetical protein
VQHEIEHDGACRARRTSFAAFGLVTPRNDAPVAHTWSTRAAVLLIAVLTVACEPEQPKISHDEARSLIEQSLAAGRPFRNDGGVWDELPSACPSYTRITLPFSVSDVAPRDGGGAEATFTFSFSERQQLFDKDASEGQGRGRFAWRDNGWHLENVTVVNCR